MKILRPVPLTAAAFAPFGDVIQAGAAADGVLINDDTCVRFNDLARVQTDPAGAAALSVFRAVPRALPLPIEMLERHPLGSQAFMPLTARPFLVVVARSVPGRPDLPDLNALCAFKTAPGQGVNFHRAVWHHPLVALAKTSDFLVADRVGPGDNCDSFPFPPASVVAVAEN